MTLREIKGVVDRVPWKNVSPPPKIKENKMTNREEHDGCKDCAFEGRMYYQSPCSDCKQNYTDKWRAKPIKKEFTEEYLIKVFEDKFQGRRAISLDEIREVTKEIFK